ncbi:hypothetical protein BGI37_04895 [Snodgrassella alvi]|jgi:hypothetical protein|nr:hypothetical protein BGI37_04895 [Snodgrassella alvi]
MSEPAKNEHQKPISQQCKHNTSKTKCSIKNNVEKNAMDIFKIMVNKYELKQCHRLAISGG